MDDVPEEADAALQDIQVLFMEIPEDFDLHIILHSKSSYCALILYKALFVILNRLLSSLS